MNVAFGILAQVGQKFFQTGRRFVDIAVKSLVGGEFPQRTLPLLMSDRIAAIVNRFIDTDQRLL